MFGGRRRKAEKAVGLPVSPPPLPGPSGGGKGATRGSVVLLVGGDEAFGTELGRLVAQGSRRVMIASGGHEADALLQAHHVVLIVLRQILPDVDARDFFTHLRQTPRTAAIPVLFLGERLGDSITRHGCRTEADGDLEGTPDVETVAAWIRSRLRRGLEVTRDSRRDPLTGLPSRAAFCEEYASLAEGCREDLEPLAVALVAVDTHMPVAIGEPGDKSGDEVLARLASTLSASLRATDLLARWSQDEFVALLPGEHHLGGRRAMEKVMKAWHAQGETRPLPLGAVTISAGLAVVNPSATAEEAVLEAGRHLSLARTTGGNRVSTNEARPTRRRERVLLVMHDPVMSKVFRTLLAREHMRATLVDNAEAALAACGDRWRFQLIVIDEQLPGKNGFDTLTELKALPRNQNVPVMMLLGARSESRVARALALGVSDYTVRPVDALSFVSRMRDLLSHSGVNADAAPALCLVLLVDEHTSTLLPSGTALHKHGGIEIYLSLSAEDARHRLTEDGLDIDVVVAPLAMLDAGLKALASAPGASAADNELVRVATYTKAPPSADVLKRLGCRGSLKLPLSPATVADDLTRASGIDIRDRTPVADSHLTEEIQRVVRLSRPAGT